MTGEQILALAGIIASFLAAVLGVGATIYATRKAGESERWARRDEELRQWRDRSIPTLQAARRATSKLRLSTVSRNLPIPTKAQAQGDFAEYLEAMDGLEQIELGHPSEQVRATAVRTRNLLDDNLDLLRMMQFSDGVFSEGEVQQSGERANELNRSAREALEELAQFLNRVRDTGL